MPKINHDRRGLTYSRAAIAYQIKQLKKKKHISLASHERLLKYYFPSKNMAPDLPCFHIIST